VFSVNCSYFVYITASTDVLALQRRIVGRKQLQFTSSFRFEKFALKFSVFYVKEINLSRLSCVGSDNNSYHD
jgi:hypothetical protein